jgi:hypothetical protein
LKRFHPPLILAMDGMEDVCGELQEPHVYVVDWDAAERWWGCEQRHRVHSKSLVLVAAGDQSGSSDVAAPGEMHEHQD